MRKKGLGLLILGYLGGIAIAMKYNKKNPDTIKRSVEKSGSFFDVFMDNIFEIHKDIFRHVEGRVMTEENKQRYEEYKAKAMKEVDNFRLEAEKKYEEMKVKGITKKDEWEKELKKMYDKRQDYFDKAKDLGKEYVDEGMVAAEDYMKDARKKLDKTFEDLRKKVKK